MNPMLKELEELMNRSTGPARDAYKNALLIAIKYEKNRPIPVHNIGHMRFFADQEQVIREYELLMEMEKRVMGEPDYAQMIENIKHSCINAKTFCKLTWRKTWCKDCGRFSGYGCVNRDTGKWANKESEACSAFKPKKGI